MVFKVKPKAATPAASIKDGTYRATVSNLVFEAINGRPTS
jgi:hypothetical protein